MLAAVAGLLALVVMAAVTAQPVLFLGAGLLVFLAATAAGVALATRRLPGHRAFLTGRPLLVAPWTATGVPTDYEGPGAAS
jgi:hypothetical protein